MHLPQGLIAEELTEAALQLNAESRSERLAAVTRLKEAARQGQFQLPPRERDINNHIHTCYSFSPYSPSSAVWTAVMAGLCTAGIVDHDSVAGVQEFLEAGQIAELPVTTGLEIRVDVRHTPIGDRHTNNPDQGGLAYLTFHGIPRCSLAAAEAFLRPVQKSRGERNRRMCLRLSQATDVPLDYQQEVLPVSMAREGGSVTERHLLFALAGKLLAEHGRGEALIRRVSAFMPLSEKDRQILSRIEDPWYDYRLLGLFKAGLMERFYLPAEGDELPTMEEALKFAEAHNMILAYPYLGDVGASVTGDKKPQTFEDAYLDLLFQVISDRGFRAVSFMPSRNTAAQISRLRALCDRYDMLQITGEDINMPFQPFVCTAQRDPAFANLYDSAFALIGHERAADRDPSESFLHKDMPLSEKVACFKKLGQQ